MTAKIESERVSLIDVVISRVLPSSISEHPEFLYPSIYDMMNIDIYIPSVCLYRLDTADHSVFTSFIHGVKNSLSQVLSLYYPMAGKWIVAPDASVRKLFCNDEGAVFVQAAIDEEMDKVFDRNDLKFPDEVTGDHAVPGFESALAHKTSETSEFPSLIVQVIRFKCGGVALTLTFNHMTVDGYGFDRFLKAWSEIATTGQTPLKPLFDRSVVVSPLEKRDILGIPRESKNLDDNLSGYFKSYDSSQSSSKFASKLFSIRNDTVERLRQKAKEESVTDQLERPARFTTFECVTAQLWRCFARISTILSGMTTVDKVQVLFPVEGRRKWCNPSLPEDFVGNMCLTASSELPCSEVTDKPLSFAAFQIRKSVSNVNHKTSGGVLDSILKMIREIHSTEEKLTTNPDNEATNFQFFVSGWSRFHNFYNLDFGYGGPFSSFPCNVWTSSGTGAFLLPPGPNSGNAMEMLIRGPSEIIDILCQDSEFIDFFS